MSAPAHNSKEQAVAHARELCASVRPAMLLIHDETGRLELEEEFNVDSESSE